MRNGSSPCMCNAGRLKPFIRTVKAIWAWTRIACAAPKPLGNIGVWCSWRIRFCTWIVFPRHREKEACPSKPSTHGEACRQQAQALIEALILYAHEQLQRGQQAVELFAALFAKQQPAMARP